AAAAALLAREPSIVSPGAAGLVLVGAVGYGASLWAYLRAQRIFGIARTASVFAIAPFVGATLAFALGDRQLTAPALVAFALVALGAYLHASERHSHAHVHDALEHEHLHVHDDDHHMHEHVDAFEVPHVHRHRHDAQRHDHPHAPDPDHAHVHERAR
ncbi:MAG: DMT family transporter, partial [Candidatus Eremiobacteraeota bacterium]|nr:DMT family transporter [Candidatus Eremiobacteraeota bacterium]